MMESNELLIIVLNSQIEMLERLIAFGKKGDMEKVVNQFKKRVKELKDELERIINNISRRICFCIKQKVQWC